MKLKYGRRAVIKENVTSETDRVTDRTQLNSVCNLAYLCASHHNNPMSRKTGSQGHFGHVFICVLRGIKGKLAQPQHCVKCEQILIRKGTFSTLSQLVAFLKPLCILKLNEQRKRLKISFKSFITFQVIFFPNIILHNNNHASLTLYKHACLTGLPWGISHLSPQGLNASTSRCVSLNTRVQHGLLSTHSL